MKFSGKYHRQHIHHDAHIEYILIFEQPNPTILKKRPNILVNSTLNNFDLALTFVIGVLFLHKFFKSCDLFLQEFLSIYARGEQKLLIALIIFLICQLLFEDVAIYGNHKLLGPKQQKLLFVHRKRGNCIKQVGLIFLH